MDEVVVTVQKEYECLSWKIIELEAQLRYLRKQTAANHRQDCEKKQVVIEEVAKDISNVENACSLTQDRDGKLLEKVDSMLAKANLALVNGSKSAGSGIPKPKKQASIKCQQVVKTKVSKELKNKKNVSSKPCKNGASSVQLVREGTESGNCDLNRKKRQKRMMCKYSELFKSLDRLQDSSKMHHHDHEKLFDESTNLNQSLEEFAQLSCVYKIFRHILDSYIGPGNYHDNIKAILCKTEEQFYSYWGTLAPFQSLKISNSLLVSKYKSEMFSEKYIHQKLGVISFYKPQNLVCFLEYKVNAILEIKNHLFLINKLINILQSIEKPYDNKFRQFVEYVANNKAFIPPIICQ